MLRNGNAQGHAAYDAALRRLGAGRTAHQVWDVFGPTVEFLTSPKDPGAAF